MAEAEDANVDPRSAEEQAVLETAYTRMIAEQRAREAAAVVIDNEQLRAVHTAQLEHLDPACEMAKDLTARTEALVEEHPQAVAAADEAAAAVEPIVAEHEAAVAAYEATLVPDEAAGTAA